MATPQNISRRRLLHSLGVLAIFVVVSTIGFYVLGAARQRSALDALHITANIFSTVGAWKAEFNDADKIWEILMIVLGIGAAVYAFGSAMALLTSGDIQRMLGRRQLTGKIQSLEDHYIVCGYGRMGQSVARSLARERVPFVVIDVDDTMTTLAEEQGFLYLLGDAADEIIMNLAGIRTAKGLVACLPHDAENVFVTLTARGINPQLQIIARSEQQQTESRLLRAGADRVICPAVIGAMKVTRMLLHPAVEDILDATAAGDLGFDKVRVSDLNEVSGRTLADLGLPTRYGLIVLGIVRDNGSKTFNPPATHKLADDEQLIVIGPRTSVDRLVRDRGG